MMKIIKRTPNGFGGCTYHFEDGAILVVNGAGRVARSLGTQAPMKDYEKVIEEDLN